MSQAHPTATSPSSSNFQLIINDALDRYKNCTKNDLRAHPLAAQLQSCDSPSAILVVLQEQVQGLDSSRSADERWTKWLDPTVNVLYAFSGMLGSGVSLVCFGICTGPRSAPSYLCGSYSSLRVSYLLESAFFFRYVSFITPLYHCVGYRKLVAHTSFRQLKMFEPAETRLSTSLNGLRCFSDVLRSTQECHRRRK
jgi:hypothetical protein